MDREVVKKYKEEFDYWLKGGELEARDRKTDLVGNWFSAVTPSFDGICEYRIKQFAPKQGETILVSDYKASSIKYKERVFVKMLRNRYLCVVKMEDGWVLDENNHLKTIIWEYAKPLEK